MENQAQQITDYIHQHLMQGFNEATIRAHLMNYGWSHEAVAQAFSQYRGGAPTPPPMPSPQLSNTYTPTPRRKKSKAKIFGIAIAVVAVAVVATVIFLGSSPKTLNKLAEPALKQNATSTAQKNDVGIIASAVANYVSTHSGVLPTTTDADSSGSLAICGTSCTDADKVTASLSYFKNADGAVQFHAYAGNLTVPDDKTLYIVNNAACKSDNSGIGVQANNVATAAFLFAADAGSGLTQQCVSL